MTGTCELRRKALDRVVIEGADHHRVDHAGEHPRAVLDRLAAPQLGIARGEEQGMTAELHHADLERYSGSGRGLLEDHGQGAVGQRAVIDSPASACA
jgi:hypothetical protein